MRRLFSPARALLVLCLLPGCVGCSWLSGPEPDKALLEKRATALIALGWNWLRVENMRIPSLSGSGARYASVCAYDLVLTEDLAALPAEEQERFRRFLPMCLDLAQKRGERCHVQEHMDFVNTDDFGWMPEPAVLYAPNLLKDIARWPE